MSKRPLFALLGLLLIALLSGATLTQAQVQEKEWRGPQRLSGPGVEAAGEAVMAADPYGLLHVFWSEVDPDDAFTTLQYAVFDGEIWSKAIDLRVVKSAIGIGSYAATVDSGGQLHLVWTEGNFGPIYYMAARAENSLSLHLWSEPTRINVPANEVKLQVDRGVVHLLYTNFWDQEPGVFYMRSQDGGDSWSNPYWLDPDIPLTDAPVTPQFLADGAGGLHATWYYKALDTEGAIGEWVRYTYSLDEGNTWSDPFTIDIADEEPDELRLPHPELAITGDQVHVVWAGTSGTRREHRYSLDRGVTWTETAPILGHLHGQGLGGGMVTDAAGRIHYFAQIRWPQAVYHVVWDAEQEQWSEPAIIYLLARNDEEGLNGRYHAHSVRAGIRAGNQLVVAFTDNAIGPLYVMYRTLDDVTPLSLVPTPAPTPTPNPTAPAAAAEAVVPFVPAAQTEFVEGDAAPNLSGPVWLGVLPAFILLLVFVGVQWIRGRQFFS